VYDIDELPKTTGSKLYRDLLIHIDHRFLYVRDDKEEFMNIVMNLIGSLSWNEDIKIEKDIVLETVPACN
jgi:hypothetical protein